MASLSYRTVISLVSRRQRRQLLTFAVLRILANLLDLLGLAGIALLATTFGAIASGTSRLAPIELPLIGGVVITEFEAVIIAVVTTLTFVLKSFFAIWLNLQTALKVAEIEGDFSERLTRNYFSNEPSFEGSLNETVSRFQTSILVSTSQLAMFLNSRISFVAEASLLVALVLVFTVTNTIATFALLIYLAGVILTFNQVINKRLKANSYRLVEGSERALSISRDLFGVRREAQTAGKLEAWMASIVRAKRQAATSSGINYTINSLPRYVIETSLILGIFAFLGGVVVFSDLPSQSVTVGVFMAGGLRLIASILPIQAAYTAMVSAGAAGEVALKTLVSSTALPKPDESPENTLNNLEQAANLDFRSVTFRYPGSEQVTVNDVDFQIHPNSKTAIVGPSGAGKTTVFELATGFKLPHKGQIRISGASPRNLLEKQPGYIGIVPQRPHLITGTLAENISLEDQGATDLPRVAICLDQAGLGHFLGDNNQWLTIEITPDSGHLSGGEIQRLGLARALYRQPRILFLDEATSALDAETESRISSVLDHLKTEMTIVLIAHRLSTVMNADNIIYLNNGKVVAQGTFAELKKSVPDFAKAVELMDLGE